MAKEIMLGNQLVGKDHPTYIIAEIGINHNGDLNIAKRMIQAAHYAHVNAVKFQKRTPKICVPLEEQTRMRETPWGYMTYLEYREHVEFGEDEYKEILIKDIPITIAGMSFGALSANAKEALGRGASIAGTSTTTGDGRMTPEERGQSKTLVYQYLPSRYGMNPDDLRAADAIEVVLGQGAKPGGGGMLLGQKISERVAAMRTLPQRFQAPHRPDRRA